MMPKIFTSRLHTGTDDIFSSQRLARRQPEGSVDDDADILVLIVSSCKAADLKAGKQSSFNVVVPNSSLRFSEALTSGDC